MLRIKQGFDSPSYFFWPQIISLRAGTAPIHADVEAIFRRIWNSLFHELFPRNLNRGESRIGRHALDDRLRA